MARLSPVKASAPSIVGVIASFPDLLLATRMRRAPDFFEIRLDALYPATEEVKPLLAKLGARLIFTARDPREGGAHELTLPVRRALFTEFLPFATYVDVELRSANRLQLKGEVQLPRIISHHDLTDTPAVTELSRKATAAAGHGATIFKVATRVDTNAQLHRLLDFFDENRTRLPLAAMGIGKLGQRSRVELAHRGSVLNYAPLGRFQVEGQLTLRRLRAYLAR